MAAAGQWIFWVSICLVAYTYLAYPALLWLFTFRKRPSVYEEPENWPSMSLIISAYNDWMAEFCSHDRSRLVGPPMLPTEESSSRRGVTGLTQPLAKAVSVM